MREANWTNPFAATATTNLSGGTAEIYNDVAMQRKDGGAVYFHGHLPVFQHPESSVKSFRYFTNKMIDAGTIRAADLARTFGVPLATVKWYLEQYRERGPDEFFQRKPRVRCEAKRTDESKRQAQRLLEEGNSVAEVGRFENVLPTTLHKAIRNQRPDWNKKGIAPPVEPASTKSDRSEADSHAPMGYATSRSMERAAAAMGDLKSAPIEFEAAADIPEGGVLLALPALLAAG